MVLRHLVLLSSIRTGLFSATQTKELKELARAGLRNPVGVTVQVTRKPTQTPAAAGTGAEAGSSGTLTATAAAALEAGEGPKKKTPGVATQQSTPSSLENFYMLCPYDERAVQLSLFIMKNLRSKIIVFVSTCACVDYFSEVFTKMTEAGAKVKKSKIGMNKMKLERVALADTEGGEEAGGGDGSISTPAVPPSSSSSSATSTSTTTSYLPNCISVLGFHGKMVPKKRNALYKKFQTLSSGVLFCTDIAARGIDFPDVDFIVQLSAPKGQCL
jgi:ATP-dependent RNA helicase DDX55/SPB4